MSRRADEDEVVYSTDLGDLRKGSKGKSGGGGKHDKRDKRGAVRPSADPDGRAKVRREKKGRGGKTVTAVYGLSLDPESLNELGKKLKRACGSGGSVKNGVIEIQGDEVDRVIALLEKEGYPAKRAGG
jgi:translation initiation factor 1